MARTPGVGHARLQLLISYIETLYGLEAVTARAYP